MVQSAFAEGGKRLENVNGLREIEVTFDTERLNQARTCGRQYVIRKRRSHPQLATKNLLLRHRNSGEVALVPDRTVYRQYGYAPAVYPEKDWELLEVIEGYARQRPPDKSWGAYILPERPNCGERFYIPDAIEDILAGAFWYSVFFAEDAEAIWTGRELHIDMKCYDRFVMVG